MGVGRRGGGGGGGGGGRGNGIQGSGQAWRVCEASRPGLLGWYMRCTADGRAQQPTIRSTAAAWLLSSNSATGPYGPTIKVLTWFGPSTASIRKSSKGICMSSSLCRGGICMQGGHMHELLALRRGRAQAKGQAGNGIGTRRWARQPALLQPLQWVVVCMGVPTTAPQSTRGEE